MWLGQFGFKRRENVSRQRRAALISGSFPEEMWNDLRFLSHVIYRQEDRVIFVLLSIIFLPPTHSFIYP